MNDPITTPEALDMSRQRPCSDPDCHRPLGHEPPHRHDPFRPDAPAPTPAGDDRSATDRAADLYRWDTADDGTIVALRSAYIAGWNARLAAHSSAPTVTTDPFATYPDTYTVRVIDGEGRIVFQFPLGAVRADLGITEPS